MKIKHYFLLLLVIANHQFINAQATTASTTNTVTATAFLGSGSTSNFDVLFKRFNVPAGKLAPTFTNFGLNSVAMPSSASFGVNAGQFSSGTTGQNTYIGQNAGKGTSATVLNSGANNTFVGFGAGIVNTTGTGNTYLGVNTANLNLIGINNTFIGGSAGWCLPGQTGGTNNTFIGASAGQETNGQNNVFIGLFAGNTNQTGSNNVYIGDRAGQANQGSRSVLIGNNAGAWFEGNQNDKLIIENSSSLNPLIWGDFAQDQVKLNGKVGIGGVTTFPTTAGTVNVSNYKLFVSGGILTEEVRVNLRNSTTGLWADYVFNKDYYLKPLCEVEKFINDNGHLPNVPSAKQVKEEGIELGNMAKIQQEKIEELTLYIIEQNKINQSQAKEIDEMKAQLKILLDKK